MRYLDIARAFLDSINLFVIVFVYLKHYFNKLMLNSYKVVYLHLQMVTQFAKGFIFFI